jgi:hypothetical protein
VIGAVGIVALGGGALTGLFAVNKNSASTKDCPQDGVCKSASALAANRSAADWATASTISFIAGGALVAAAAVIVLTAPRATTTRAFVSPTFGLGSAGVMGAW